MVSLTDCNKADEKTGRNKRGGETGGDCERYMKHLACVAKSAFLPSSRIASYIPGTAYFLGFKEQQEKNAETTISASVVASSADSVDVKIKFPGVCGGTITTFIITF